MPAPRRSALVLVALMLVALSLPTLLVGHFLMKRTSIERELCVMRDASPETNTCHGNCYLMRQLEVTKRKADAPFEQLSFRPQPSEPHTLVIWPPVLAWDVRCFPAFEEAVLIGARALTDPVPWV
ncbi:MAG: hypothetical protein KA352_17440 [Flavobacteriales bacterium]|nr:hypothetical protein [Flavobacteriales bacterium]